jgi:hypothetical protein
MNSAKPNSSISLRQAALTAGFGYLFTPVTIAEVYFFPQLVIPGHIEQTVQNLSNDRGILAAILLCYLVTFILDIVIAWALYILLTPVNRSLALLAAWFRLIYVAIGFMGLLKLTTVFHLVHTAEYQNLFSSDQLLVQIQLLLNSFSADWSFGLTLFGIHLALLGWLVFRSGYIPRPIGAYLFLDGLAWIVRSLSPYLYPNAHLGFLFVFYLGELVFMLWLLIMGWRLKDPAAT